jgi:NmrA-like family
VRALRRDSDIHSKLADEVVLADFDRVEPLKAAFGGAHGVLLVTNAWAPGVDESRRAPDPVNAGRDAGVQHVIWSTLPNAAKISGGKINGSGALHLSFRDHVHQLDPGQEDPGTAKTLEPQHGARSSLVNARLERRSCGVRMPPVSAGIPCSPTAE